jgi:hypothetical protein
MTWLKLTSTSGPTLQMCPVSLKIADIAADHHGGL